MDEISESEEWVVAGISIPLKVIPDYQLETFKQLSEDSMKLFRISIIILSIYASVFGFLFQSENIAVGSVLLHPAVLFSLVLFPIALGSSMGAYLVSRHHCINSIKTTDYLELSDGLGADSALEEKSLLYEKYWKNSANYNNKLAMAQNLIYIGGLSIYFAVLYASIGLIEFYISLPALTITILMLGPLLVPFLIAIVFSRMSPRNSLLVRQQSDDDSEK